MGTADRAALQVCAEMGDLIVWWSPYVAAEIARVATRAHVVYALGQPVSARSAEAAAIEMESVRTTIDAAIHALEQCWSVPTPAAMQNAAAHVSEAVPDATDSPVLAGAIATGARFLLSRDEAAFPHGGGYGRLAFWHPDTFLTTLFLSEDAVYARVRLLVGDAMRGGALLPRRHQ